jgi:small toxic polypeptide LdrA/B/C/D
MNYLQLNAIFVAVALAVFAAALLRRPGKPAVLAAVVGSMVVLVVLTAVLDSVMIGSGLFDYGGNTLAGARVWLAPVEDFAYPLAAALLLPGLWLLFTRGRTK